VWYSWFLSGPRGRTGGLRDNAHTLLGLDVVLELTPQGVKSRRQGVDGPVLGDAQLPGFVGLGERCDEQLHSPGPKLEIQARHLDSAEEWRNPDITKRACPHAS
jgi:hypothetical protein